MASIGELEERLAAVLRVQVVINLGGHEAAEHLAFQSAVAHLGAKIVHHVG